ncbi:cell adhesion molecule 3-like [Macrobrachium nipponense]|uniref:cell adhesion molecule 3-like n=1 Tax=Macrobrachium nipponense TaxID=159736 RepID=UPI0030C7A3C1
MPRRYRISLLGVLVVSACSGALRLKESVIPPYKLRGETVELRCDFEKENSSIYSVKWFKDDEEFYRYVPRDNPQYNIFPRNGVKVDQESLQPNRVVLKEVDFNTSGQYRCEVSAEGPEFNTVIGTGSLLVVEPPTAGPVITGGKEKYKVNETVDLLCTSSPSRPATFLSWRINDRPAPRELVMKEPLYVAKDGLVTQFSRLMFVARPHHFVRGLLRVKCVAEINERRMAHHPTIPETFRAWERSFQASTGHRVLPPTYFVLAFALSFVSR